MILELSRAAVRDEAKRAACEQATGPATGPRLVPTVRDDGQPAAGWVLEAVLAHIDRADVVRWDEVAGVEVLVVGVRGDYVRRFRLQPVRRRPADELVAEVACEPCGLPGERRRRQPLPGRDAEYLAGVHDQLHHGGGRTARAVPMLLRVGDWCLPSEQLQEMREWAAECPWRDHAPDDFVDDDVVPDAVVVQGVEDHYQGASADAVDGVAGFLLDAGLRPALVKALRVAPCPPWEVDAAGGKPIYLGQDLTLACELAHAEPGSHLFPLSGEVASS